MANPEHLQILKQGVEVWNRWRNENSRIVPDLKGADLRETDLYAADLSEANLSAADLSEALLYIANLRGADLRRAGLEEADFSEADLREAVLRGAGLRGAILYKTDLYEADLRGTDLRETYLGEACLLGADLRGAALEDAQLAQARLGATILSNLDLKDADGLEDIQHLGPSHLSADVLQRARGNLPRGFLRACGLSDLDMQVARLYSPDLSEKEVLEITSRIHDLRVRRPLQISPLFIAYSQADSGFEEALESQLDRMGVRFWRAAHPDPAAPVESGIELAIRQDPTMLLVLSENSVKSDWLENEVRRAGEMANAPGRYVLCPVALDDSWKSGPWPGQSMEYNILDFSQWEDEGAFEKQFRTLFEGLDLFYK